MKSLQTDPEPLLEPAANRTCKQSKQKRAVRTGFNVQTRQKVKVAAKTVVRFRIAKGAKDAILGAKAPSQAGQTGKQAAKPTAAREAKQALLKL